MIYELSTAYIFLVIVVILAIAFIVWLAISIEKKESWQIEKKALELHDDSKAGAVIFTINRSGAEIISIEYDGGEYYPVRGK